MAVGYLRFAQRVGFSLFSSQLYMESRFYFGDDGDNHHLDGDDDDDHHIIMTMDYNYDHPDDYHLHSVSAASQERGFLTNCMHL